MQIGNWKLPRFFGYVLAIQVIAWVTLVLDIPIARQVVGFVYLTFVPGLVLLRILKLEKSNITETILFSMGLSIVFLMSIGLLMNELGSIFVSKPLSTEPLTIIINSSILFISILSCFKNKEDFNITVPRGSRIPHAVSFFVLPLISIIGVIVAKAFDNNLLLILIIAIIPMLFLLSSFSRFSSCYPFALVSIASTLLLSMSLVSSQIRGYDIHSDYYIFMETKNISYWDRYMYISSRPSYQYVYNSMLSVTVLPTIFSNMLNIEGTMIFKIIYPFFLSLVPLVLYELYREQWGKKVAFLSVLFFMSNTAFFDLSISVKQMIAELFFLLLFLVLLKKDMYKLSKWTILVCFGFALVVSYYTMNYIFIYLTLSTWLCGKIFAENKNKKIDSAVVVFFIVLTFLWYIYVVEDPFNRLVVFLNTFKDFYEEFFYLESRSKGVLRATGIIGSSSFLHYIGRILHNITELFILVGFITLIARRKKQKLDTEYFILTSLNIATLLMFMILPDSVQIGRIYHVTLLFLSPLFIIGGSSLFENILKIQPQEKEKRRESFSLVLTLAVLVPFFLFQTGFIYEISGDPAPSSILLSKYRMDEGTLLMLGVVREDDFFGAMWLSKYVDVEHRQIYSDARSKYYVLTSSMINRKNSVAVLSNTTVITSGSYIYLSRYNTLTQILIYDTRFPVDIRYNMSELPIFDSTNVFNSKIYSNGACEIHKDLSDQ